MQRHKECCGACNEPIQSVLSNGGRQEPYKVDRKELVNVRPLRGLPVMAQQLKMVTHVWDASSNASLMALCRQNQTGRHLGL